ncbi:MAG: DNA-binding response regulator [Chloroflexi bacterium]|nr:MAG: DNA-binding response regulator [Chloroflexota bacterium]MBL1194804.1 DNA-binding response regulator [Chloroflexota bacterium]NOH12095.1 response regulator transcription factor [Chloroflexota bacterium]
MERESILIIEDDELVAKTITRTLKVDNFKIKTANSGVEGLKIARRSSPDLIILDVIMPGMDGYQVCKELRADPMLEDVPILFLTAKSKQEDKIMGLQAGADDYLSKPFNVDELLLRIQAILRRSKKIEETPRPGTKASKENVSGFEKFTSRFSNLFSSGNNGKDAPSPEDQHLLQVNAYTLDKRSFELDTPHEGNLLLTPVQFDLIYHLMSHPDQVFSPGQLLEEVWDYPDDSGSPDLVRVHIKNLRKRVEADPSSPSFIRTVPGYGYTINSAKNGRA